jgi:oligopeptide transport system ATP-binding protein
MSAGPPLLAARQLYVQYPLRRRSLFRRGGVVRAVDGVGFNLHKGETLGIVGESGCGKSTLARALVGLQPIRSGSLAYGAVDLATLDEEAWRPYRRELQMVFQDPLASLDPRMTIGRCVAEPLQALLPELGAAERDARVRNMLERVGLSAAHVNRYPHEFSGGQCQRVGIARALVLRPKVLVCDEPVSALDVSVQAQIVNLLGDLQREDGLSMIFIAHDLAVVRQISQRVLVMYLGKVMEQADRDALFAKPAHPYTRALLSAIPRFRPDSGESSRPQILKGEIPSPASPPQGCVFVTRCPIADAPCGLQPPHFARAAHGGHSACHFTGAEWQPG